MAKQVTVPAAQTIAPKANPWKQCWKEPPICRKLSSDVESPSVDVLTLLVNE